MSNLGKIVESDIQSYKSLKADDCVRADAQEFFKILDECINSKLQNEIKHVALGYYCDNLEINLNIYLLSDSKEIVLQYNYLSNEFLADILGFSYSPDSIFFRYLFSKYMRVLQHKDCCYSGAEIYNDIYERYKDKYSSEELRGPASAGRILALFHEVSHRWAAPSEAADQLLKEYSENYQKITGKTIHQKDYKELKCDLNAFLFVHMLSSLRESLQCTLEEYYRACFFSLFENEVYNYMSAYTTNTVIKLNNISEKYSSKINSILHHRIMHLYLLLIKIYPDDSDDIKTAFDAVFNTMDLFFNYLRTFFTSDLIEIGQEELEKYNGIVTEPFLTVPKEDALFIYN